MTSHLYPTLVSCKPAAFPLAALLLTLTLASQFIRVIFLKLLSYFRSLNPRIRLMSLLKMFQASCPALLHYTVSLCQSLCSFPACPNMVVHINNVLSLPILTLLSAWNALSPLSIRKGLSCKFNAGGLYWQNLHPAFHQSSNLKLYLPLAQCLLYFSSKTHLSPTHTFLWKPDISYNWWYASLISSISYFLMACKIIVSFTIIGTMSLMK